MKPYATTIIFKSSKRSLIDNLPRQKDFYFSYREDPSSTHWEDEENEPSTRNMYQPTLEEIQINKQRNLHLSYELIIYANNEEVVENVASLVYAGLLALNPDLQAQSSPKLKYEIVHYDFSFPFTEYYTKQETTGLIYEACLIAIKAWQDVNLIYSLEKFRFSLEHDSVSLHSVDPYHGQVFNNYYPDYRHHVNQGYAFLAAYSIIEELGLEIRSSAKNPRFIDGDWNPKVKDDIIKRLNKIGIKDSNQLVWIQRGKETLLQKKLSPKFGQVTQFYDGEIIRDRFLRISECIHYSSYIRNYFLAHKFNDVSKYLTPYDVYNIQNLTSYLILHKVGLLPK